jgi:hypothetical protein
MRKDENSTNLAEQIEERRNNGESKFRRLSTDLTSSNSIEGPSGGRNSPKNCDGSIGKPDNLLMPKLKLQNVPPCNIHELAESLAPARKEQKFIETGNKCSELVSLLGII